MKIRKWFEGALKTLMFAAVVLVGCDEANMVYRESTETPEASQPYDATAGIEPTATPDQPTAAPTDIPSTPEPTPEPTDEPGPTPKSDSDGDGIPNDADCDDARGDIFPGADEVCNSTDDDCDGDIDEGVDQDDDGYTVTICIDDCDDDDPDIHPDAAEDCDNEVDDNCDGAVDLEDEDCGDEDADGDRDGFTEQDGDCNDSDPDVNPDAAEVCDGIDNDCQGGADEGFDDDGDGFTTCDADGADCDDLDPAVHPGAEETCNGEDQDCDGQVDEGLDCESDFVRVRVCLTFEDEYDEIQLGIISYDLAGENPLETKWFPENDSTPAATVEDTDEVCGDITVYKSGSQLKVNAKLLDGTATFYAAQNDNCQRIIWIPTDTEVDGADVEVKTLSETGNEVPTCGEGGDGWIKYDPS